MFPDNVTDDVILRYCTDMISKCLQWQLKIYKKWGGTLVWLGNRNNKEKYSRRIEYCADINDINFDVKYVLVSKTFCPLLGITLTHPHGVCTLCCESEQTDGMSRNHNDYGHGRQLITLQNVDDFSKITNSDSFSRVRKQMLNGEKPDEWKCWDLESVGVKSKRYYESRVPMDVEHAKSITNEDGTLKEVEYEFVELRLGNHCNVQCRTCNPYSSSRWNKEWDVIYPERPTPRDDDPTEL